jgi:hypothetical protein
MAVSWVPGRQDVQVLKEQAVADLEGFAPASAEHQRRLGARTHVQARAWMDAGWRVASVNLSAEKVRFR